MKKWFVRALCLALILAAGSSFAQSAGYTVTLDENATTGYQWTYAQSAEGIVSEADNVFLPPENQHVVGAAGTHSWTFEGVKPGLTQAVFSYMRSFEKKAPPARQMIYLLCVDDALNVTGLGTLALEGCKADLKLSENATTGYEWSWQATPKEALSCLMDAYQTPGDDAMLGAAGQHAWSFEMPQTGDATLTLTCKRPFGDAAPAYTLTYVLRSEKGNALWATDAQAK